MAVELKHWGDTYHQIPTDASATIVVSKVSVKVLMHSFVSIDNFISSEND